MKDAKLALKTCRSCEFGDKSIKRYSGFCFFYINQSFIHFQHVTLLWHLLWTAYLHICKRGNCEMFKFYGTNLGIVRNCTGSQTVLWSPTRFITLRDKRLCFVRSVYLFLLSVYGDRLIGNKCIKLSCFQEFWLLQKGLEINMCLYQNEYSTLKCCVRSGNENKCWLQSATGWWYQNKAKQKRNKKGFLF